MSEELQANLMPEELLKHLQTEMQSDEAQTRLATITRVMQLGYSSPSMRLMLEKLALTDKIKSVRMMAVKALDMPIHRHIQERVSKLSPVERKALLTEIKDWVDRDLIKPDQAEVLAKRYNFDIEPTPARKEPELAPDKDLAPAPPVDSTPPAPRPSLTQTLLSESSIKIALYLGAFFVIASAAILAAAIEAARLPILLMATFLFGAGALVAKRRLHQPSFALFIVFSFLLPTDANVLADILNLGNKQANAAYWMLALFLIALVWAFGTWFYKSRLFSLAAFVALALVGYHFTSLFDIPNEIFLLAFTLINFIGLSGVFLLKKWQGGKFALPLFLATQLGQLLLFGISFDLIGYRYGPGSDAWHILTSLIYFGFAAYYVLCNLAYPFVIFPWIAMVTMTPIPWIFSLAFASLNFGEIGLLFLFFGLLYAAGNEFSARLKNEGIRKYEFPLLVGSLIEFLAACGFGFFESTDWGFFCLMGVASAYALIHTIRPRAYVWTISLLFGVLTYFTFFHLHSMRSTNVFLGYQFLGAAILLLSTDILTKPDLHANKTWRLPLRIYGWVTIGITFVILLVGGLEATGKAAIGFGVLAAFVLAYALRYKLPWLTYLSTLSTALTILYALSHFEVDAWLPALMGLAGAYYLGGLALKRSAGQWFDMLRFSGLGLGAFISIISLAVGKPNSGWYMLSIAALFIIEIFLTRVSWMETGIQIVGSMGLLRILLDFDVEPWYILLGISLFWLSIDLALAKLYLQKRQLAWPSRAIGGLFVLASTVWIMGIDVPAETALSLAVYALFFIVYTWLYNQPHLLYAPTAFLALTAIYTLRVAEVFHWVLPLTLLAVAYYTAGFIWRRQSNDTPWALSLLYSGLGLGVICMLFSFSQSNLWAALAVALTATLFAVEAFARRNVWWALPADLLYITSYFILLAELNVDEPQFYSVGAAILGMIMHYLLTRSGSKVGTFIAGMVSQLALLGTTYIQFVSNEQLGYFAILFFQALIVLIYGIVIHSRSLVITPIIFAVLAVVTVMWGLMQGIGTIIMIGCTGILLIGLGIFAVLMRDHIKELGERFTDWRA